MVDPSRQETSGINEAMDQCYEVDPDVDDCQSSDNILPLRSCPRRFSETVVNGVVDVDQKKTDCLNEKVTVGRLLLVAVKADS